MTSPVNSKSRISSPENSVGENSSFEALIEDIFAVTSSMLSLLANDFKFSKPLRVRTLVSFIKKSTINLVHFTSTLAFGVRIWTNSAAFYLALVSNLPLSCSVWLRVFVKPFAISSSLKWISVFSARKTMSKPIRFKRTFLYPVLPDLIDQALDGEAVSCLVDDELVLQNRNSKRVVIEYQCCTNPKWAGWNCGRCFNDARYYCTETSRTRIVIVVPESQ